MAQFPAPARGGPANSNQPSNSPNVTTNLAGDGTQPQKKHRKSETVADNVSSRRVGGNAPKAQAVQNPPLPKHKPANAVKQRLPVPARALPKFLRLPPEVQKRIFEIAASDRSWRNQHVKGWVCISRKVREWVEPCIYQSIELPCDDESGVTNRERKKLELLEAAFQLQPKKFAKNVKRIFTLSRPELGENSIELKLLSTCDNLEVLECWSTPRKALTDILMTKHWPKLKNLCLNIDLLPKDENVFRFPLFQHLTHLDFKSEETLLPSWKSLESLKCLTHVRINMMRKFTTRKETTTAVDHVCSIAREVRNHFPPKLQHFVILIPIDILYYMCIGSQKHKGEKRWKMMESIRIGDFDERIMLGCEGDTYHWFDQGGPCNDEPDEDDDDEDGDDEDNMEDFGEHYLHTTPIITYPTQPRNDPFDPQVWEEVEEKNKCGERKSVEKYRIFVKTGVDDNDDDNNDNDSDSGDDDEDGDDDDNSSE